MDALKWLVYDWAGFNLWLFHVINNVHEPWLDQFMLLGSRLGDHTNFHLYLTMIVLAAVITVSRRTNSNNSGGGVTAAEQWLLAIAVFVVSYQLQGLLVGWLKPVLDFPRPSLVLPGALHVVGTPEYHHSLPSGHAVFAMLVGSAFWGAATLPARLALLSFVVWVGISRISLGMHFPADVVAGFVLSLTVVLLVRLILMRIITQLQRL